MNRMVVRTVLATVIMTSSAFLCAEEQQSIPTFTTSFEFWVNGTRFPAGSYILDNSVPTMIIVRSKDGRLIEQAPTLLEGDGGDASGARVVFISQHGRYDLAKIWGTRGNRVLTHVTEQNLGEVREVPIIHVALASSAKQTP